MSAIDPNLVFDARWTAVTKLEVDAAAIATWDDSLVRDVRLLVPVDVQALVVTPNSEPMVWLPSALNEPGGDGPGCLAARCLRVAPHLAAYCRLPVYSSGSRLLSMFASTFALVWVLVPGPQTALETM